MESITLKARAKINLTLDVKNKRADGYHNIVSLMEAVELADIVYLETIKKGIEIECDNIYVPKDEKNIAFTAAEKIINIKGIDKGIFIRIQKNIPMGAGLAGGSSNAAAVLKGINTLWGTGFSTDELVKIGIEIGSDVPFCILNTTCLVSGMGERLDILPHLPPIWILLIKPKGVSVLTKWAYDELDKIRVWNKVDINALKQSVYSKNIDKIAKQMYNVFEYPIGKKYPVINKIKKLLLENNALGSVMSGSGPTVFGLYKNKKYAQNAMEIIKQKIDGEFYLCRNYNRGGGIHWTGN